MFYCSECREKEGYPESLTKSVGNCEICGVHSLCNSMPSSQLPKKEEQRHVLTINLTDENLQEPASLAYKLGFIAGKISNGDTDGEDWEIHLNQ